MLDFYAYVSGNYQVTPDTYQGVSGPIAIQVYHQPEDNLDVPDMIVPFSEAIGFIERMEKPTDIDFT